MHSYMHTFTHTFELRKHIGRDGALVFVHAILSEHIGTEKKLARNLFPRTGWHYHVRMYVSMCSALPSIAHPGSTLYFSYYERNGQTTDKLVFSLHSHRFLMPMNLCIHDQTKARNEWCVIDCVQTDIPALIGQKTLDWIWRRWWRKNLRIAAGLNKKRAEVISGYAFGCNDAEKTCTYLYMPLYSLAVVFLFQDTGAPTYTHTDT